MNGTTEVSSPTLEDAQLCLAGSALPAWSRVRLHGAVVVLNYDLNHAEVERRGLAGLAAVTSPDALRVLIDLPVGTPVPLVAVDKTRLTLLRALPLGIVHFGDGCVTRLAVPPIDAGMVVVAAQAWRPGLERAGRFAPFCARTIILPRAPRDLDSLRMEADFYGIGVITCDDGVPVTVVPPEPFVRHRFTAAGWLFLEHVYQQLI